MNSFLNYIPRPDVAPLPSPGWLFVFFIVFTFILHLLFMNLTLGGSILMIISRWRKDHGKEISKEIAKFNTFTISMTITTGVAPLLFLQVVYGQFFYSSSVILGWKWLLVLAALSVGYYCYYLYKLADGDKGFGWGVVATIMFLYVALMLVTNTLLSMQPDKWLPIYTHKISAFDVKSLIPRFLHMILAATAFTGVFLMVYSKLRKSLSEDVAKSMYNYGKNSFLGATLLQIVVGPWFLLSNSKDVISHLMHSPTGLTFLIIGIISGFLGTYLIFTKGESAVKLSILMLISMISMVLVRRVVENAYFSKYFDYTKLKVSPQWDVFILFCLLLVGLLIVLFITFKKNYLELKNRKEAVNG